MSLDLTVERSDDPERDQSSPTQQDRWKQNDYGIHKRKKLNLIGVLLSLASLISLLAFGFTILRFEMEKILVYSFWILPSLPLWWFIHLLIWKAFVLRTTFDVPENISINADTILLRYPNGKIERFMKNKIEDIQKRRLPIGMILTFQYDRKEIKLDLLSEDIVFWIFDNISQGQNINTSVHGQPE
jgi:hypothetical protein